MILLFKTNDDASVQLLGDFLLSLNDQHKDKQVQYRIEIKRNRAIRSNDQNALYWAVLKNIAVVTGYSSDDLHEYYKKKFNSKMVFEEHIPQSTTKLDTLEMTSYINQVMDHAGKFHGIKFVNPNDMRYAAWLEEVDTNYNKMFAAL